MEHEFENKKLKELWTKIVNNILFYQIIGVKVDMNKYRFLDLYVNMKESFKYTVTEEKLLLFKKLTGDDNLLHCSEKYAKRKGYKGRVVYGMLLASLISTFCGVYLPGEYSLIQQIKVKFHRPIFIGDILTIEGIVKEIHESVRQAVIKVSIRNVDNEKAVSGLVYVCFVNED